MKRHHTGIDGASPARPGDALIGKETTMSVDAATAGDRDIRPGDFITGTVTTQGRAVAIHKETAPGR